MPSYSFTSMTTDLCRLSSFSGGIQEGAYTYHPKHMCVEYPTYLDDNEISTTEPSDPQSSAPTPTGYLIYRAKLASLCREAVDAMRPVSQEGQEVCYDVILGLDAKFQDFLNHLPTVFQLNPESIQQCEPLRKERPYITWQRTMAHISIHTRLCRLHRPYHLKGMTDPKYEYSRRVCLRSAQIVLDLRRSMDESRDTVPVGLRPSRFWVIVQHVALAALTLATDVSFDGTAPDTEARKGKVLAAYETLERSTEEPCAFRDVIKNNLRMLMSTLDRGQQGDNSQRQVVIDDSLGSNVESALEATGDQTGSAPWDENWDQLWSEFLAVAPDLDFSQWDQLLDIADT